MSDINDTIIGENTSRHGKTRYHYITNNPNTMFNGPEQKPQSIDFSFLSPETIGKDMQEKQRAKAAYKDHYLIDLNDKQLEMMNMLVAQSENPEEEMFKLATIVKYADAFNLPMQFVSNNLEAINKEWIGTGATPYKNNFQAVADSFLIGVNTLNLSTLGNRLMIAEKAGNEKEVQSLLKQLKEAEDKNLSLQDRIPRSWVTNILKAGANTIPFSSAVLLPSLAASVASPLASGVVGFGISATMQNGLEYWELRKAGVKRELAEHLANTSAFIQAGIETSLGNVAGVMAKGLKIDTVTSKVLKKLTAQRVLPTLARVMMQYGGEMVEEGVEEALQELVSAGTKATAAALQGEGVETEDAWTIAGNVWESFKGGMAGSIVLGIPGAVINGKTQFTEAKNVKKEAVINPSKEAFIKQSENLSIFEGLNEADKNEYLSEYYDSQQHEREQFQKSKAKSYEEWLAPDARIEGETVRDSAGRVVYETDAEGNPIHEQTEAGIQKKEKKYGKAADVVRAGERLYLSEGYRHEKQNGRIDGEYIVGNPTEQTEYNDYGHIYYSFDKQKNTVTINEVRMQSDAYESIIKEFVRDFGEKFTGAEIVWEPKGEALQKIKAELIAENPRGEKGGLQYFTNETEEAETRAAIKLNERLKETMPTLTDVERNTAVSIFTALAHGAGMDTETYLNTYYGEAVITNTPPADMAGVAAQEGIDTKEIKGASEFKELPGDIKALVYVSEKADFSTFVHEAAHIARKTLQGNLLLDAEKAFDVVEGKWTRSQEEAFARGFEQYLREGKAPNAELKSVFQKAAEFLTRIYQSLKELVHLNDDIRAVYDELLTGEKSVLREASANIEKEERLKKAKQNTTGKHPSLENYEANRITETADDKQLDTAALKAKYLAFAKKWFQGNSYHNADTDTDIRVSRDVIGEWKAKTKSREQILSMKVLDKLVETAVETNTTKDKYGKEYTTKIKYFEAGLTVDDKTYKAYLTVKEIQDTDNKAYHYYLDDVALEDIILDQIKKEAALSPLAPLNERGNQPLLRGTEAALRIDAHSKRTDVPLLHGFDSTVQEKGDTVKASETKKQVVDEAYRQATEAARQKTQESIEASKAKAADLAQNAAQYEKEAIESYKAQNPALSEADIKEKMQKEAARMRMSYEAFTQMQAQEARNLKKFGDVLFQVEQEFFDEVAESADAKSAKEAIEEVITVGDPDAQTWKLFYSSAEERAKADKTFRDAIGPELEAALQKDIKNEKIKDETFLKMASEKEALRSFLRQYNDAAQAGAIPAELTTNLDGVLPSVAYAISNGHPFTEKQQRLAMDAIKRNVASYRNIFAEINGYTALRSLTDAEKAFSESFSKAATEGRVSRAEKINPDSQRQAEARSRADIDDARFLEEMADDEKLNAFLKEAAELSVFDFEQNTPADEAEQAYFEDVKRKQERIYREMRNFSWKGTLAKVLHGEAPSAKSIANIRGQMQNAAHSFRSLYADIMERSDLRVQDADTTDARITTRLKSRPYKSVTLESLKLDQMSNAQKEALIRALDNEDIEKRVRDGAITNADVEHIQTLVRAKNQTIKSLETELADAKAENHNDTKRIGALEKKIKDERIARAVLADTIKARDVALKAVMKRISLKTCDAEQAQGLAAVQWFLKDKVQKALHANIDSDEQRLREAYTLWKTNGEYRQTLARMSTRRKEGDFKQLINNLDKKDFKDWTADDKKLARRLIPARNKFFSLGLYARSEQNFADMHTSDLTPEAIDAAVSKILPESLVAKLKHQSLKQWTVDELIGLAQVIEEKHREGKQKYMAKIAAKQAEAARIRDASIKTLRDAKGYSDDNAGWSEDEKKKKGGFDALKRKLKYAAMRPYAFIEMLDGGKRGALYDMLEFEQRECYSRFKAGRDTRVEAFNSFLEKQKLTLADFEKKKTFENFYAEREQKSLTLTVQEILGAYLASFDEKSRAAVQYGNFAEQAERDMAKTSDSYGALDAFTDARYSAVLAEAERLMAADARLKAVVEYLQAEYKKEGVRLREHNITVNNAVTEIRDNYFPMQRLEVSGEEDARQTQKKIIGEHATGTRHGVGKGQTKARIDIGKANQMPINLAALTTYFSSVEANERLYAYDAYAQKLNRVIKGYEAKNFRRTLENAYGSEAVRYLDKQVNTIIDPTAGRVYSDSDKLLRVIRGNTAAAYLGFKLSSIIKQGITSPAPFMQYVNPVNYAKAASDLAFHHKEMTEFIYSRSKLMQDRSFDMMQNITEELAKQAKTKAGKALTQVQQFGMQGLEMIDKACVAPGWLAAYREEAARLTEANKEAKTPKTDNEIDLAASRYADDVLVRTQPSGRAEELAPLFREGGEALRLLLQFQSSLNVIYNNLRHDLPNAIKNKQYKRAAGIVTGYALAGIMTGLITEGFGGGDDEPDTADKVKKTIYFAFTQGTDSVPVINGMVNSLAEKLITGKTSYRGSSSLYPAFEKAVQGTAALRDADIQKAAGRYAEAAALTLGLPTSGTKEAIRAAEQVFNGQVPSALWGRR
nr:MAG TPA: crystallin beta/gamma motif-containing protein [Caudoviricetes sp.]